MHLITKAHAHGDQRNVHLQLTENKRRLKRRGKSRRASTKNVMDRAIHIFNTGTLNDYTHPKEIDPYWDILYRQYEFLIYIDLMYRSTLKQNCISFNDAEIASIVKDLDMIKSYKRYLLGCLMNFMNVMYGSVLQRRFYGWKHYIEDFVSKFNEVAIMNLTKLKFDADQTRCSVYFYQAFWLSGLSITTKITEDLKKNESSSTSNNNKELALQDQDFDELYETLGSSAIDVYNTIDESKHQVIVVDESINPDIQIEEIIFVDTTEVLEEATKNLAIDKHVANDVAQTLEEVDFDVFCTLNKFLYQLGINATVIHSFSDKKITKLGKIIKKKLLTGEIIIHDSDKKLLATLFSSPLLN